MIPNGYRIAYAALNAVCVSGIKVTLSRYYSEAWLY
jgi:hypothetical protein